MSQDAPPATPQTPPDIVITVLLSGIAEARERHRNEVIASSRDLAELTRELMRRFPDGYTQITQYDHEQ